MLRRSWTLLRYRVALRAQRPLDLALAGIGVLLMAFAGHGVLDVIGGACTLVSTVLFTLDLRERWRRAQDTEIVENEDYNQMLAACRLPRGYRLDYGGLALSERPAVMRLSESRPYITDDAVNAVLQTSNNPLRLRPDRYEVPEKLQEHRAQCIALRRPDFNDPKVGLRTDLTPALLTSGRTVEVQRTDYVAGVSTNEMACEQFNRTSAGGRRRELLFAVSDLIVEGDALVDLEESLLSNHIGVTTLVVTADDRIVLQDQGKQMIGATETSVGASGSLDFADLGNARLPLAGDLQRLLRVGMEREAAEELSAAFVPDGAGTVLTGHARYLSRGGKPEFFGISRSTSEKKDLHRGRGERRYVSGIRGIEIMPGAQGLIEAIDALLEEGATRRRSYSLSMVVCLRMARAYLERVPGGLP